MKFSAALIFLFATVVQSQVDDGSCPDTHTPRCYCSGPNTANQNCDVTQRITQIAQNTTQACASYCAEECGEEAGSSFGCYPNDEELKVTCDGGPTNCDCACDHNVAVPSPMPFVDQCAAFCSREDVCGDAGNSFGCGSSGGASSKFEMKVIAMMAAAAGVATLTLF